MINNPKIEKVNAAIIKTKETIAEYQKKLRELERQKTDLENLEIIALYRSGNLNNTEINSKQINENADISATETKKGEPYAFDET